MESNNKKIKELRAGVVRLAEELDDRFSIAFETNSKTEWAYYKGLCHAVEALGGDWESNSEGKHKVFIAGVCGRAEE